MADTEREKKREERRQKRKEIEELRNKTNGANDKVIHDVPGISLNGDPDVSRETEEGLEQKSEAALPDVVKVPSGLSENWDRPTTPENDEDVLGGKNGYKSYSNALRSAGDESGLQQKKDDYSNTVLTGQRYDSDDDAAFEPELRLPENEMLLREQSGGDTEPGNVDEDEWSNVPKKTSKEKPTVKERVRTPRDKPREDQRRSLGSESGLGRDEWRSAATIPQLRGVNKPPILKKEDHAWIREIPKLPEEPIPKEPDWLDLVRKRRWRSTVKARFPQTERERIQFERRLDTSKKGLKFNPRGEPIGITGPDMDDELSMYLIQQRRRIESDSAFETSAGSRSNVGNRSLSDSEYACTGEFSFDQDPKNRELAAAKGILNLSRPPLMGPKKEVHKNLAMERSRRSTMQWRFSIDPHEEPIWTKLSPPEDIVAINEMEGNLGSKYWANKIKFQTGQFDPPPVLPKPRSRAHSSSEVELGSHEPSSDELRSEEVIPSASRSAVREMRERLAAGDFRTSTPIPKKELELEPGYMGKLRDIQQKLADEAEASEKVEKPSYISEEELSSLEEKKRNISEDLFTEKVEKPKPIQRPKVKRSRSDAELFDLLASRKQEADASTVEMEGEIASVASAISKEFAKLNAREEIEEEIRRDREGKERKKREQEEQQREKQEEKRQKEQAAVSQIGQEEKQREKEEEEKQRQKEREEEQRQKEREQEQRQKEREAEQRKKEREEEQRQKGREEEQRQKEREEEQRQKELEADQRREKEEEPIEEQTVDILPEFLVKLKDCELQEGSDLSLEVVVSGQPQPTVEWFFDYRKLTSDKRCKILSHGTVHSLTLTNISLEEEGIYECVATNSAGKVICDCEVLVND